MTTKLHYSCAQNLIKRLINTQTRYYQCHKVHKRTQSDGLIRAGELPAVLFPVSSVSLLSCCGGYMATCSRLLQQQQGKAHRWCVCWSVWVCEHKIPCVGQKDYKVIPCITRTPATLHNRPNRGTLAARPCPSFLYFSFPSFHQTPATLTF